MLPSSISLEVPVGMFQNVTNADGTQLRLRGVAHSFGIDSSGRAFYEEQCPRSELAHISVLMNRPEPALMLTKGY